MTANIENNIKNNPPNRTKNNFAKLLIILETIFLIMFLLLTWFGFYSFGGLCFAGFWFCLAGLVRFHTMTKSFSYTIIVFGCVTTSMYFPDFYLHIGSIKTTAFIIPILQVIMFGMGTQLSLRDFQGILQNPYGVFVGMICQFSIMPTIGFLIATGFGFEPEIAAGIILVGSVPCGIASNVMNFIAKSNMALAVSLTAVSTLVAPILTPFLVKFFAGQLVEVLYVKMMVEITHLVILPIIAGLMFRTIVTSTIHLYSVLLHLTVFVLLITVFNILFTVCGHYLYKDIFNHTLSQCGIFLLLPVLGAFLLRTFIIYYPDWFDRILSLVSMIGLLLTIVIINAAGRDYLLKIGFLLIFACLLHNLLGFFFGYWLARFVGLDERSCRTIAIEVGMQNGGLASGLALQMGKVATVGLAPAIFGPLMNITGSSLATWWRNRPVEKIYNNTNN
ncbi:MAG: bile acid:sodium symporter family protein [Planctomycetaceae bacterium]|jgi:BASS family bile acid:Na+ symporter|nr:bile acid:sodium symporter family protein [Planctomycetaceae bacterium]